MNRTIVDVTQLVHWSGMLAGIPRVMNELGTRFYAQKDQEVIFVSWVKELRCYCEIDFAKTMANRGKFIAYVKKGEATPARDQNMVSATIAIKGGAGTIAKVEADKKPLLKRAARFGLTNLKRLSGGAASFVETRAQQMRLAANKKVSLKAGDRVFIPWGEWWDDNFIDMLKGAQKDGVDIVQIIHDLGPITTPQYSSHSTESLTKYCHEVVPVCSLVLVVSEHAKQELETWLKQQKHHVPPIRVFRNGDDFAFAKARQPDEAAFKKSGLKGKDFILAHGTVEVRKNHMLYYYVYKLAKQRGIKLPKLLISGRLGWNTEPLVELISKDTETKDDILFLNAVSDEELSWLFDNAMFSMYVSFYEGWGVPVAESLARGTPCITANVGSMLEIADGIAYYSSPASSDELLAQMQYLLNPKNLATARARTKKYKQTSWDDSFKQINAHIKEVLK